MHRSHDVFATLADRAAVGDSAAQRELRRQLEPQLIFIVRRVIHKGQANSAMDRRILAEAHRVGRDADDDEHLIRKVAHSVSALFVEGLRVKQARHIGAEETVCN